MSETTASAKTAVKDGSPFVIPGPLSIQITVSILFSICFLVFSLIIGIDMVRKHRTGELQESLRNIGNLAMKIPVVLFQLLLEAIKFVWIWFTDLFRSEENKRRKKKKNDPEVTLTRKFDSKKVIERLAVKPGLTTARDKGKGVLATVVEVTEEERGVVTTVTGKGKEKDVVTIVAAEGTEAPKLVESDGEDELTILEEDAVVMDGEGEKETEKEDENRNEKGDEKEKEEEKDGEKEERSHGSHERQSHDQ